MRILALMRHEIRVEGWMGTKEVREMATIMAQGP